MDAATCVAVLGGITAVIKALAMLVTALRARREEARTEEAEPVTV